ncbi:MAG: heavy-metal-associated domain-containing protein [Rikenellaceae bacterium]
MKKLIILLIMTFAILNIAEVEAKESKNSKAQIVTTTFITDIDCEGCERKILNSIPFKKGVSGVKVDIPTKRVSVSYNSAKSSDTELIEAFKKIGVIAKPHKEQKQ